MHPFLKDRAEINQIKIIMQYTPTQSIAVL